MKVKNRDVDSVTEERKECEQEDRVSRDEGEEKGRGDHKWS